MGVVEIDWVSPGSPDANLRYQEALPDAYLRYQP